MYTNEHNLLTLPSGHPDLHPSIASHPSLVALPPGLALRSAFQHSLAVKHHLNKGRSNQTRPLRVNTDVLSLAHRLIQHNSSRETLSTPMRTYSGLLIPASYLLHALVTTPWDRPTSVISHKGNHTCVYACVGACRSLSKLIGACWSLMCFKYVFTCISYP